METRTRLVAFVTVSLLMAAALPIMLHGDDNTKSDKSRSAKEIADQWRFTDDKSANTHFVGVAPTDSTSLYTETGSFTEGRQLDELWNHYAAKCGSDLKYGERTIRGVGKATKDGQYVILDSFVNKARTTTFSYTNDVYTASVLLWRTEEMGKVFLSITISKK